MPPKVTVDKASERAKQNLGTLIMRCRGTLSQSQLAKRVGLPRSNMKYIEDNLLVEYQKRDRALIPSRRRWRVNGKIVPMRDQNGNIIFEADKFDRAGHNLPKAQRWMQGNSIRGQLHKETFYGAIVKLSKEKEAEKKYVVRRELKYAKSKNDSGFKNWDELKNAIVDEHLFELIRKQFDKGTSLKEAVEAGIYMLNKKGERVNKIRHIRCYADSKNPLKLKRQTFVSNKDHKNNYYVGGGDLYAICKYECVDDEKKKPLSEVWSLYEIADNRNHGIDAIPVELLKNNTKYRLISTLKSGDQVLLYKDNVNELVNTIKNEWEISDGHVLAEVPLSKEDQTSQFYAKNKQTARTVSLDLIGNDKIVQE